MDTKNYNSKAREEIIERCFREIALSAEKIGINLYKTEFIKDQDSIDFRVIDQELQKMYVVGKEVASIFPNENIFRSLFRVMTIPGYMNKAGGVLDYVNTKKHEPIHRYGIEIYHPEDLGKVELEPLIVIGDLYNEFNNGMIDMFKGRPKSFFFTFSQKRVVKKLEKIAEN